MKEETLEDRLRKLVSVIAADTKFHNQEPRNAPVVNPAFPLWFGTGPVKDVGVIIEDRLSLYDMSSQGLTDSFPTNLHWLVCPTYESFETLLKTRGIPGFVSFDSDLSKAPDGISGGSTGKPKDGLDCARLLIQYCRAKKMPVLPPWSCHAPILTKKQEIESLLENYQLKVKR
jgi:hypothetical protein